MYQILRLLGKSLVIFSFLPQNYINININLFVNVNVVAIYCSLYITAMIIILYAHFRWIFCKLSTKLSLILEHWLLNYQSWTTDQWNLSSNTQIPYLATKRKCGSGIGNDGEKAIMINKCPAFDNWCSSNAVQSKKLAVRILIWWNKEFKFDNFRKSLLHHFLGNDNLSHKSFQLHSLSVEKLLQKFWSLYKM